MLNAKEKALDLYEKMWDVYQHSGIAQKCALICVDEKIETLLPYAGLLDIKKSIEELEYIKLNIYLL